MQITEGYTFDDVLLVPKNSPIKSRSDIATSVDLGKGIKLKVPIVSANMKNVTGSEMATALSNLGALPILHRFFDSTEEYLKSYGTTPSRTMAGVSVGVNDDSIDLLNRFHDEYDTIKVICVDVAHGDSTGCAKMTEHIAKKYPDALLIAGNVATWYGAKTLYDAGADGIKVGVGPGCFIAGTRVLMSNGIYKNIEDVQPGDKVINKNGKSVNVTDAFCTGTRRVSKIRHTLAHKPTYATPDHKFWVGDLNSSSKATLQSSGYAKLLDKKSKTVPKQSKYKWKPVDNFELDCLLIPNNIDFKLESYFKIELYKRDGGNGRDNKKKLDVTIEPSYDLGYLFGTFLGDGHASCINYNKSNSGSVSWYFGKHEIDIANKLAKAVEKCIGKLPPVNPKNNIQVVSLYYKPLADFLYKFGKKTEKHLPEEFLINDKEYLQGILDGLIDSDGHVESSGRICFTNTSEKLIELFGVVSCLLTGVFPNMQMRPPTVGGLKNCNIENCNDGYVSRINTTASKRLTNEYQVAKLLEVVETDLYAPVYDITVDCDTHSFIANNAIVHNSLCTTRIETGNGVPQLTALKNVYEYAEGNFKVIADGGIKSSGDIVKALCFSDAVMLGNLLAGTDEAPGNIIKGTDGKTYKEYVGSSTHKSSHVEGVSALVPYKGPVGDVITKLMEGLRSGMSYQGVSNLVDLKKYPEFVTVSNAGLVESRPHDVIIK